MKILDVGATFGFPCANIFDLKGSPHTSKAWNRDKGLEQLDGIDLVIFGGGADIAPIIYGHKNVASGIGANTPSKRDELEIEIWKATERRGINKLGICRGAQFLCAMTGGWLVQHVDNHAGKDHVVQLNGDPDGDDCIVANSYHHQMCVPHMDAHVMGYTKSLSENYVYDVEAVGFDNPGFGMNVEIALFSHRNLGFQCHPEYLDSDSKLARKVRRYVQYYLGLK